MTILLVLRKSLKSSGASNLVYRSISFEISMWSLEGLQCTALPAGPVKKLEMGS